MSSWQAQNLTFGNVNESLRVAVACIQSMKTDTADSALLGGTSASKTFTDNLLKSSIIQSVKKKAIESYVLGKRRERNAAALLKRLQDQSIPNKDIPMIEELTFGYSLVNCKSVDVPSLLDDMKNRLRITIIERLSVQTIQKSFENHCVEHKQEIIDYIASLPDLNEYQRSALFCNTVIQMRDHWYPEALNKVSLEMIPLPVVKVLPHSVLGGGSNLLVGTSTPNQDASESSGSNQAKEQGRVGIKAKGEGQESTSKEDSTVKRKEGKASINIGVNILNNLSIPVIHTDALSKGLKYVPRIVPTIESIASTYDSVKTQILKCFDEHSFSIHLRNRVIGMIDKHRLQYTHYIMHIEVPHEQASIEAAFEYMKEHNIIAKAADKNLGLTLMSFEWYDAQVTKHLSKQDTYSRLIFDPSWNLISHNLKEILATKDAKYWIQKVDRDMLEFNDYKPAWFHVLPKIHKTPIGVRPIVPGYEQITCKVSEFLAKELQKAVIKLPWIINRQIDFINYIESYVNFEERVLASFDVESMYTSIDTDKAIRCIGVVLLKLKWPEKRVQVYMKLLRWVMTNNYFKYGENWYYQIKGTAMGTSCAPQFANLYLGFFELLAVERRELDPKNYRRFLDDIFSLEKSIEDVGHRLSWLNGRTPDLRFTVELGVDSLNFLDLTIFKGTRYHNKRILDLKLYQKPTNLHLFTRPESNVPPAYRFSWLCGEQIRLIRNCSNVTDYLTILREFKKQLLDRGYDKSVIKERLKLQYNEVQRTISLNTLPVCNNTSPTNIVINHTLIYDQFVRLVRQINEFVLTETATDLELRPVVRKGRSLQDMANGTNKWVLSRHEQSRSASTSITEIPLLEESNDRERTNPSKLLNRPHTPLHNGDVQDSVSLTE